MWSREVSNEERVAYVTVDEKTSSLRYRILVQERDGIYTHKQESWIECAYGLAASEVAVTEEHWDDHAQPDVSGGQLCFVTAVNA